MENTEKNPEKSWIRIKESIVHFDTSKISPYETPINYTTSSTLLDIHLNTNILKNKTLPLHIENVSLIFNEDVIVRIFEDEENVVNYTLERDYNYTTPCGYKNMYIHSYINITENYILTFECYLSNSKESTPNLKNVGYRLQPYFLKLSDIDYSKIEGKGLYDRGLLYKGKITSSNIALVAICDKCKKSFAFHNYNFAATYLEYFYSSDSSVTFTYSTDKVFAGLPEEERIKLEETFPKPRNGSGDFKTFNPFRCPHCKAPYIDFEKYPEIRQYEVKGNVYLNQSTQDSELQ